MKVQVSTTAKHGGAENSGKIRNAVSQHEKRLVKVRLRTKQFTFTWLTAEMVNLLRLYSWTILYMALLKSIYPYHKTNRKYYLKQIHVTCRQNFTTSLHQYDSFSLMNCCTRKIDFLSFFLTWCLLTHFNGRARACKKQRSYFLWKPLLQSLKTLAPISLSQLWHVDIIFWRKSVSDCFSFINFR